VSFYSPNGNTDQDQSEIRVGQNLFWPTRTPELAIANSENQLEMFSNVVRPCAEPQQNLVRSSLPKQNDTNPTWNKSSLSWGTPLETTSLQPPLFHIAMTDRGMLMTASVSCTAPEESAIWERHFHTTINHSWRLALLSLSLTFDGMLLNISIHIPIKQETMILMSIVMFDLNKNWCS
jgi:hypothetical protein